MNFIKGNELTNHQYLPQTVTKSTKGAKTGPRFTLTIMFNDDSKFDWYIDLIWVIATVNAVYRNIYPIGGVKINRDVLIASTLSSDNRGNW